MLRHVKKFHSEAAKRRAEANDELARMELLHSNKVPRLSDESQQGGAVTTRVTKRVFEETIPDVKELKPDLKPPEESEKYHVESTPLFVANVIKLGP